MRFARGNRDKNEPEIIEALEAVGATVTRLYDNGVPDLLVGYKGRSFLLEVKMPLGPKGGMRTQRDHEGGRGELTAAQVKWWDAWTGEKAIIVRSVAEAIDVIHADAIWRDVQRFDVNSGDKEERSYRRGWNAAVDHVQRKVNRRP